MVEDYAKTKADGIKKNLSYFADSLHTDPMSADQQLSKLLNDAYNYIKELEERAKNTAHQEGE